ncbi:MAG: AAA family ATPase, partial [Candidatus Binatia bacterium]
DLQVLEEKLTHHHILLGMRDGDQEVRVKPYGTNLLIAGSSGSGKSALAISFLERLVEQKYQVCVVDPEGDYGTFEEAVALGTTQQAPNLEEILQLIERPEANVVVNLVALPFGDRPEFFVALLSRLLEMRARTGRPHWLVVDETHHVLPTSWQPTSLALPQALDRLVFITVEPHTITPTALAAVDVVVAVGDAPEATLRDFCETVAQCPPGLEALTLEAGEVLVWPRDTQAAPFRMRVVPGRTERRRHRRKYAEGELPPERSFYFRGPEGKLNLRAQNLMLFMQIADGVDDATWLHHLRQGDYTRWFREGIKDEVLAEEAARVAKQAELSTDESRALIKAAIERDYTLPASSPSPGSGG